MLFRIEDGETHWVSAGSYGEALELFYQAMGHTPESHMQDHGEKPVVLIETAPNLRVNLDGPPTQRDVDEHYPRETQFVAEIPINSYDDLKKGLVSSTAI